MNWSTSFRPPSTNTTTPRGPTSGPPRPRTSSPKSSVPAQLRLILVFRGPYTSVRVSDKRSGREVYAAWVRPSSYLSPLRFMFLYSPTTGSHPETGVRPRTRPDK